MYSLIILVREKRVIYQVAQTIYRQHMHLLYARAAVGRNTYFDILRSQQTGQFATVIPGKRYDTHIARYCGFNGFDNIAAVPTGGNRQQYIACMTKSPDLLGINFVMQTIVCDGC